MHKIRIAVVMTVFNRIEKTRKCIDSILAENTEKQYVFSFFITDDGSTDNTREVLEQYKKMYSDVKFVVLNGSGNLFWNKGMHIAYTEALKNAFDFYLWVNNDVVFVKGFVHGLLEDATNASKVRKPYIICGSVSYHGTNELSYGGAINLSKINPYKRKLLIPNGQIQVCDCINGNCLLIPNETATLVGEMDDRYEHGFGDFDYGYRLKFDGGQCYVASNFVGYCDRNSLKGTWKDPTVPILQRIKKKNSPLGQPPYSHRIFLKKWYPKLWWFYLFAPYVSIVITGLKYKIKHRG